MKNLNLLILLLAGFFVFAQAPEIEWQKSLGGSGYDNANSVQQTMDGGYIVAGSTKSNNGDVSGHHGVDYLDAWLVKLSTTGNIEWQKTLGGSGEDGANAVQQTTDGGYIVAGWNFYNDGDVTGNHGGADYWIVKSNASGEIEWQKSLGGSQYEYAKSIEQTIDGGYIVAGYTYSNDGDISWNDGIRDYWIVKLDIGGFIEWEKTFGGSRSDQANSIKQVSDGGFIILGISDSNNGDVAGNHTDENGFNTTDYWIVKLNISGEMEWGKSLGGSGDDYGYSVEETSDKGYIIAGATYSNDGDVIGNHGSEFSQDMWVIKLNIYGDIEWQKSLGGSLDDFAYSTQQVGDGGFIVAGGSTSLDGDITDGDLSGDFWLVKLNLLGGMEWQKTFGGSNLEYGARSIQQTNDGGYVLVGLSFSSDGDVTVNYGAGDIWIVKLSADLSVEDINQTLISIYPNPTKNILNFSEKVKEITVYDLFGKIVKTHEKTTQELNISNLPKGTYIVKGLTENGQNFTNKIIKD